MKRDMDLIRLVMLKAQRGEFDSTIPGYEDDAVMYHQALAIEKGLLKGSVEEDNSGSDIPAFVLVEGILWAGHDFIDAIESDSNWAKVKQFIIEAGKQLTLETIKWAVQNLFGAAPA